MTKSIAIVGGGIVGATAAYYVTKYGHQVTVFDAGIGQATSAAAGIICPWLSKRRNKVWYRLAAGGAAFYHQLLADLTKDGVETTFYRQTGAVLLKKKAKAAEDLYQIGLKRRVDAPEIGALELLEHEKLQALLPTLQTQENALYVEGAARVDGSLLVQTLLEWVQNQGGSVRRELVSLTEDYQIHSNAGVERFDYVILATGAWLPQILGPLGWQVDIRGQKGQLVVMQTNDFDNGNLPVIMPEGEIDVLPLGAGKVIIGASHENEKGYDLTPDQNVLERLMQEGRQLFGRLDEARFVEAKVGTRAYTSDFSPFFGELPGHPHISVASGLGSSGLTTGPLIGYELALLATGQASTLPLEHYQAAPYLSN